MGGIINNLGVEIEFTSVNQRDVSIFLANEGVRAKLVNDASCTRTTLSIGDITIDEALLNRNLDITSWARRRHIGGELVSNVIESNRMDKKWFNHLAAVISYLSDKGEVPSLVTGIHVHCNVGGWQNVPLEVLKSLVKIWSKIEAAMYRITIGEMGYSRGSNHLQYAYYRPLVPSNGPAVITTSGGNFIPCFELSKLLAANTTAEFFQSLSGAPVTFGGVNKYHPAKYHGMNLYSIVNKGTAELRTANYTNKPGYLYAWIRLFQQILAVAFADYLNNEDFDKYEDLPLGYNGNFSIQDLIKILKIRDEEVIVTLEELWNISDWEKPVVGYQFSHLGHGIGRNMPGTLYNTESMRKALIPTTIPKSTKIHRPEEFINDAAVTAVHNNIPDDEIVGVLPATPQFRTIRANTHEAERIVERMFTRQPVIIRNIDNTNHE